MRSFLSLLISLVIASLGDVANLSIANNISFAAIGVMGAYYTINWLASELTQFGVYAYRVERRDEWAYVQVAAISGLVIGIIVTACSGVIPLAFGIDDEQKTMLASMLIFYILHLPIKAVSQAFLEITRLTGALSSFRWSVSTFYIVSIPLNLVLFFCIREVWCVIVASIIGNVLLCVVAYILCIRKLPYQKLKKRHLSCVARYGAPLVGERMVQRVGLTFYGILASYLPAEMYAVHSICLQAVYMGDVGDSAYSAALLVLVPDKDKQEDSQERYVSERERMIAYRRKTAWLAVLISFAMSYIFAFVSHAEANLALVMWFTFFYAFSFILMAYSTPGKDFLVIQKKPVWVMLSTFCGVPAYIVMPLIAVFAVMPVNPVAALYFFGLTGTVQIGIRAVLYFKFIRKMDEVAQVDKKELRAGAREVEI